MSPMFRRAVHCTTDTGTVSKHFLGCWNISVCTVGAFRELGGWTQQVTRLRYLNPDKNTNKRVLIAEVTLNDRQDWCCATLGRKQRPGDRHIRCPQNYEPTLVRFHVSCRHLISISLIMLKSKKTIRVMDRTCNTHGRDEKCIWSFGWKAWREEETTWKT
jgi:hypothetical protein